ncbi:MAG: carboxypeptidase-like regulatory domain-containing protein, partial [Candidatus Sulfotelmatobacter sp.]
MFWCRTLLIVAYTLMVASQPALAQQTLGAINGTVTDSTGAVVSNVNIKAHAHATNLEVTATSKSD